MAEDDSNIFYDVICPECGVGNMESARECLVCGLYLENTLVFMEESLRHGGHPNYIIEYRKSFWGDPRTGKVVEYSWKQDGRCGVGKSFQPFDLQLRE